MILFGTIFELNIFKGHHILKGRDTKHILKSRLDHYFTFFDGADGR